MVSVKVGRNDPCPCGSGKKYKKCCWEKLEAGSVIQPLQKLIPIKASSHRLPSQQAMGALVSLFNQQHYSEAESAARSITASFPQYGLAWKVLGAALNQMGRSADALACMQKTAALLSEDADAHYNLGITLHALGRLDEAELSYRHALRIKPDFIAVLNNLALLLDAQDKSELALSVIHRSLQIKETAEAKSIFVACAKRMECTHASSEARTAMVRALTEPWGRPSELMRISTDLVKLDADIAGGVKRALDTWPAHLSAQELFGANGLAGLSSDTLLCALLDSAPNCDIEFERFLTMARRTLLETASAIFTIDDEIGAGLNFYCALARQCFINEYVFFHSDEEIRQAGELRDSLVAALAANTRVSAMRLVAVAAYFPLDTLSLADRLLEISWTDAVAAVLEQQIREPVVERQMRANIPCLTVIEDEVSLRVQGQYEDNPYPRWVKAEPSATPENIAEYLFRKFPLSFLGRQDKYDTPDILIAGCGTGQHSIGTARQFQGAQMLAVDLSKSSLAYARRKTCEQGLTSISYAQADLLKLGSLGRSFDVIESVGVLHHLAEPWTGWQVLLSLLRPSGFMRLGFYSEVARRNIVEIRDFIAEKNYGATDNEIRRGRQDLLNMSNNSWTALQSRDFFSISSCRDLLFHVQEHHMTLTGIDAFLRANNLQFIGFEIEPTAIHAYKQRFPDDRACINLAQWQIFENENPDTFCGMYQFWIQKA